MLLPHCRARRLVRAVEESKRRAARAAKEKHAADVAAAELRGKAEAERESQRMEVRCARSHAPVLQWVLRLGAAWCVHAADMLGFL